MQCWKCEQPAQGVCRFCGRMVCKDHAARMPFILTIYVGEHQMPKAVVVADAIRWSPSAGNTRKEDE